MNLYDIVVVRNACQEIDEIKSFLRKGQIDIVSLHWLNQTVGKIDSTLTYLLDKMEKEVALSEYPGGAESPQGSRTQAAQKDQTPEGETRVE